MSEKHFKLRIEKYRTIEAMEVDLRPGVEGFVGANAQGKTNILNALQDLLSGGDDPSKIKDGEEKYTLRLDVFDGEDQVATVARIQTQGGSRLESRGLPKGQTAAAYLTSLFDARMLNPIRLLQDNPVDYLKEHLPVTVEDGDFPEEFADEIKNLFGDGLPKNPFELSDEVVEHAASLRLEVGRQLKDSIAVINDMKVGLGAETPKPDFDEETIRQEIASIQNRKDTWDEASQKILDHEKKVQGAETQLKALETEIEQKESQIQRLQDEIAELKRRTETGRGIIAHLKETAPPEPENQAELARQKKVAEDKLKEVKAWNAEADRRAKIREREELKERIEERYKRLDRMAKYFKYEYPRKVIERVKLPVDGLEFKDKELFVNGRRIDLLSETERGLVAVKLATAIAKQKGHIAICFDGVEIMDPAHRKEFIAAGEASGLKVLYTRQGKPEHKHETEIVRSGA